DVHSNTGIFGIHTS
nr:RecName: Full=Unknown protein from spot 263 of 2D-PAGE of etiolated coleoptile [Zea mays]